MVERREDRNVESGPSVPDLRQDSFHGEWGGDETELGQFGDRSLPAGAVEGAIAAGAGE
jgi:hypothetical protein